MTNLNTKQTIIPTFEVLICHRTELGRQTNGNEDPIGKVSDIKSSDILNPPIQEIESNDKST